MGNEILREVWRNRDEFAKQCNYDLDVMVERLAQIERDPRISLVNKRRKTPKVGPKRQPHPRRR